MAKPLPVEKWTAIFKPFSIPTWMFFMTFTLGAGPVLATLVHLSTYDPVSNIHGVQRSGTKFSIYIATYDFLTTMENSLPHFVPFCIKCILLTSKLLAIVI